MIESPDRRHFLRLASNVIAVTAIGAAGTQLINIAEAIPIAPDLGRPERHRTTPAQWGGPPGPPRHGPRRGRRWSRRGRRWVCWWHRGRRRCGWRW
jgi:hypothetical protein